MAAFVVNYVLASWGAIKDKTKFVAMEEFVFFLTFIAAGVVFFILRKCEICKM